MSDSLSTLTEEEEQLYDRQIRLWGMDAQNRIRNAKILIIGVNGVSCEVIKNLVLAGINTIGLCDESITTEDDINNNFLIPREAVGINRAIAAKSRTEELNPRVDVQIFTGMPIEIDTEASPDKNQLSIKSFDIVVCCVSRATSSVDNLWFVVNDICRKFGRLFFAMDSFGWHGLTFIDLGDEHRFVTENREKPAGDKGPEIVTMVPNVKRFCSYRDVLTGIDWTSERNARKLRRISEDQFLLLVIQQFCAEFTCYPNSGSFDVLDAIWAKFTLLRNLDLELLDSSRFQECLGAGNVPVNAVLGGLVTQEIIKAISGKNEPVGNFVLFNGISCAANSTFLTTFE